MIYKKALTIVLEFVLICMLIFSTSIFANAETAKNDITLEEAKAFLTNYEKVELNDYGENVISRFKFSTDQDLTEAALYLQEQGTEAFLEKVDEAYTTLSNTSPQRIPTPVMANVFVKGDGTHKVSYDFTGLINYDKVGSVEYSANLSCNVVVKNGNITKIKDIAFKTYHISTGGSLGAVTINTTEGSLIGTVSIAFDITKTISSPTLGIPVKSETVKENFGLMIHVTL